MSKYNYMIFDDDQKGSKVLCIYTDNGNKEVNFVPIAEIINASKYETRLINDFIEMYISVFESLVKETEDGMIKGPEAKEWDLKDWIDDILYWRENQKVRKYYKQDKFLK